jgi:hypothetical protein
MLLAWTAYSLDSENWGGRFLRNVCRFQSYETALLINHRQGRIPDLLHWGWLLLTKFGFYRRKNLFACAENFLSRDFMPINSPLKCQQNFFVLVLWVWVELYYDRRWVGQSVLVSSSHVGLMTRFLLLSDHCGFWYGAPSLTRGRDCLLQCTVYNIQYILLSQIWDSPNLEDQVPVFISPRNRVARLYPRALGFDLISDSVFVDLSFLQCMTHELRHSMWVLRT